MRDSSGRTRGDLDVVAWDAQARVALVFEVKWPIDAQTLAESNKVDAAMSKGYAQVARLREELEEGRASVRWPEGWAVDERATIHW